ECRRKELDLSEVITFEQFSAQTGAAIGNTPSFAAVRLFLSIKRNSGYGKFFSGLPNHSPVAVACDPLTHSIQFSRAMHFRSGRDDKPPIMPYVFSHQSDDRRIDGGRIDGHNQ